MPTKEPREKIDWRLYRLIDCISDIYWIEEVLGLRDAMEISKFHQVGVDNRRTGTNRNDESPTFDEEREDRKIRQKHEILSVSSLSCDPVRINKIRCDPVVIDRYASGIPVWNAWKQPSF